MSIPAITPLPDAPSRGDTEATFTSKANAFVAALPTLVTEINAVSDAMETTLTNAQTAETNAETAETNAETAQAAAELAAQNAASSANFKGEWSALVGALAVPASVSHNDFVWLLLTNLADVTASEPSTTNSDWLLANPSATSLTLEITANTNGITAGNVVELVSTGGQNVQNIYHCEAPTISSLATLDGTNDVTYHSLSRKGDTEAFISFHKSSGLATLGVLTSDSPPIIKQTLDTTSNDFSTKCAISRLSDEYFAVVGLRNGGTNCTTGLASAIGTNAVTLSTVALVSGSANVQPATCALTSSNWFVAYADSSNRGKIVAASSNGTNAPNLGTAANLLGGSDSNTANLSLGYLTSNTAIAAMSSGYLGTNYGSNCGIIERVSLGTNISVGTTNTLDGTNNCTYITQSPIDSNHTLCAYNNATTSNGMLAVIQANGANAPTVISRAVFESVAARYCALSAHQSDLHSLTYSSTSNNLNYASSVKIDTNYNITIGEKLSYGDATSTSYNAIAALTPTTAIAAFQGNGADGFAGTLTLTPTPVISGQLVGIAQTSATNGADATVAVGPVWETTNTLTLGADYYASGSGGISTNASPIHVGKAESTSELLLDLRGAPEAGKQQVWEITTSGAFTWTAPEDGEYEIFLQGAGGSGGFEDSGNYRIMGGNAGNHIRLNKSLTSGSSVSGSIGTGGAAATSNGNGNAGIATTATISSASFSATGGNAGKRADAITNNTYNATGPYNEIGATGCCVNLTSSTYATAGGPAIFGNAPSAQVGSSTVGVSGINGSGGTGGNTTRSGAGGNGLVRITLIHGS